MISYLSRRAITVFFSIFIGLVLALCQQVALGRTPADTPNIVLIMADDLGLGDVSHYNKHFASKKTLVETPTLDALAREGMWFTDAHSPTALCSPSRYSVMSGNYTYRSYAPWGVWGSFRKNPITPKDTTIGRVAQARGYQTGFIGKWHLGGDFYCKGQQAPYRGNDSKSKEVRPGFDPVGSRPSPGLGL